MMKLFFVHQGRDHLSTTQNRILVSCVSAWANDKSYLWRERFAHHILKLVWLNSYITNSSNIISAFAASFFTNHSEHL